MFKTGDSVRVIGNRYLCNGEDEGQYHYFEIGTIGKVLYVEENRAEVKAGFGINEWTQTVYFHDLELVEGN